MITVASQPTLTNQANISLANRLKRDSQVTVNAIRQCGNCNAEATRVIAGTYYRCHPCAEHFMRVWQAMRSKYENGN